MSVAITIEDLEKQKKKLEMARADVVFQIDESEEWIRKLEAKRYELDKEIMKLNRSINSSKKCIC